MIEEFMSWLDRAGLPTDSPVELVGSMIALVIAAWFIMHLLFDD